MNRTLYSLLGLLFVLSCSRDGITIYAPPQLAEATVLIDGKPAGHFQKAQRFYRSVGWKGLKGELNAPSRSETVANLPPVAVGDHELRIEKAGYGTIKESFHYTGAHLEIEVEQQRLISIAVATP